MNINEFLEEMGIKASSLFNLITKDWFRKTAHEQGVRGGFNVKVKSFEGEENYTETPYSSNVEFAAYDPVNYDLFIGFNNRRSDARRGTRIYIYFEIYKHGLDPEDIFYHIKTSPSPGSVVWELLRRTNAPYYRAV